MKDGCQIINCGVTVIHLYCGYILWLSKFDYTGLPIMLFEFFKVKPDWKLIVTKAQLITLLSVTNVKIKTKNWDDFGLKWMKWFYSSFLPESLLPIMDCHSASLSKFFKFSSVTCNIFYATVNESLILSVSANALTIKCLITHNKLII